MMVVRVSLLVFLSVAEAFVIPLGGRVGARKILPSSSTTGLAAVSSANSLLPVRRMGDNVSIAGKIFPFISKFFIGPQKWREITEKVGAAVDLRDVLLLAALGWAILPICTFIFNRKHQSDDVGFKTTRLYRLLLLSSQFAKVTGVVYIIDVVAIALNVIGVTFPHQQAVTAKYAQVLYTLWIVFRLVPYKRRLIETRIKARSPDNAAAKIKIYDAIANVIIAIPTLFILLDELKVPIGRALQSIFGLGGVATLVFSYASKDIAGEIINGLALASSNKYDEGDYIVLQDGSYGVVANMGWTSTDLRGTDEIDLKVPNSQLAKQRIGNLSRLEKSRVKQTLWFSYDYIDKIPSLIDNIKSEIASSCQNLITNGSRPFRVTWTDYKDTHLEVLVDCHFRHRPNTEIYYDTRQNVLLAVARAAKTTGVPFNVPSVRITGDKSALSAGSRRDALGVEEESTAFD